MFGDQTQSLKSGHCDTVNILTKIHSKVPIIYFNGLLFGIVHKNDLFLAMNWLSNRQIFKYVHKEVKVKGDVLELAAKQPCQFSPFGPIFEVNGLDWHNGSQDLISIAVVANYSFDVKNIYTWAPAFLKHNKDCFDMNVPL